MSRAIRLVYLSGFYCYLINIRHSVDLFIARYQYEVIISRSYPCYVLDVWFSAIYESA